MGESSRLSMLSGRSGCPKGAPNGGGGSREREGLETSHSVRALSAEGVAGKGAACSSRWAGSLSASRSAAHRSPWTAASPRAARKPQRGAVTTFGRPSATAISAQPAACSWTSGERTEVRAALFLGGRRFQTKPAWESGVAAVYPAKEASDAPGGSPRASARSSGHCARRAASSAPKRGRRSPAAEGVLGVPGGPASARSPGAAKNLGGISDGLARKCFSR